MEQHTNRISTKINRMVDGIFVVFLCRNVIMKQTIGVSTIVGPYLFRN